MSAFEVGVKGTDWYWAIEAETRGKAKYLYLLAVQDAYPDISFKDLRCRPISRMPDTHTRVAQREADAFNALYPDWSTPWRLFETLDAEFHFTLDVCADPTNAKCAHWFGEGGLDRDWSGVCWCNPPYGREIGKWIEKALRESKRGCTVVLLLPARTDTQWFHDYCLKGEVRFLRGRLNFDDIRRARAPFPSMLVVFRNGGAA